MTPETAPSNPAREAGPIVIAAGIVLVVALVSLARIRVPGADPAAPDSLAWPAGAPVQSFRDPDLGLALTLPADWERVFEPAESSGSDVRAVFRDPEMGAILAVEAWDATSLAPFPLWLGVMAGDMATAEAGPLPSEDTGAGAATLPGADAGAGGIPGDTVGLGAERPPNAVLAGTPAWVMWRIAGGETPAVYAAFLQKGGRYLRLQLEQPPTGRTSGEEFRRILASVTWPEGSGEVAVPVLPGAQAP